MQSKLLSLLLLLTGIAPPVLAGTPHLTNIVTGTTTDTTTTTTSSSFSQSSSSSAIDDSIFGSFKEVHVQCPDKQTEWTYHTCFWRNAPKQCDPLGAGTPEERACQILWKYTCGGRANCKVSSDPSK